ncbi:hypothetical protein HDV05_006988 [Chytridiales sp. JEL 0842]|nr:hypothetical protein HDV05_006988 [Chytridiales sp. JEL 0842]
MVCGGLSDQWLFADEDMATTPSVLDGMTPGEEARSRFSGCRFINDVGKLLSLPPEVTCTAKMYLQRFFMRHSFGKRQELHPYMIGGTALYLACKTRDHYRKLDLLINAFRTVANTPKGWAPGKPMPTLPHDVEAVRWREQILLHEETLCSALCFDLVVELPHGPVASMLKQFSEKKVYDCPAVKAEVQDILKRVRWHSVLFCKDTMSSTLPLRYDPKTLAVIIIFMGVTAVKRVYAKKEQVHPTIAAFVANPFLTEDGVSIFSPKGLAGMGLQALGHEILVIKDREKLSALAQKKFGALAKARLANARQNPEPQYQVKSAPRLVPQPAVSPEYATRFDHLPTPSPGSKASPEAAAMSPPGSLAVPALPSPDLEVAKPPHHGHSHHRTQQHATKPYQRPGESGGVSRKPVHGQHPHTHYNLIPPPPLHPPHIPPPPPHPAHNHSQPHQYPPPHAQPPHHPHRPHYHPHSVMDRRQAERASRGPY